MRTVRMTFDLIGIEVFKKRRSKVYRIISPFCATDYDQIMTAKSL